MQDHNSIELHDADNKCAVDFVTVDVVKVDPMGVDLVAPNHYRVWTYTMH